MTTYFRRAFHVSDSSVFTNLGVAVLRDDGVAVYLNGVEVFRENLPEGRITNRMYAVNVLNADAETNWVIAPIPPGLLQNGTNVIAVEIHQAEATSTDISFDLELAANSLLGDFPPQLVLTQPSFGSRFAAGTDVLLGVSASDPDGPVAQVTFAADDLSLGSDATAPFTFIWSNAPFGLHRLTARAVDSWGVSATSAPVYVAVGPPTVPFSANLGLATNLILLQDAALISNALRLTTNTANRTGGAYLASKQYVAWGFESVFEFHISALGGQGGEGLAFVIQNNPAPLPGTGGANLGYAGISNCLAIEIDTRSSSANPYNELSIQTRGTLPNDSANTNALDRTTALPNITGEGPHVLRVLYAPGLLQVFLDDAATPAVSAAVDLAQLFPLDNGRAWVGFTASTATDTETHDVRWWYFNGLAAPIVPRVSSLAPQPNGTMQLEFFTQAGRRYQWQYSHDLVQWHDVLPIIIGTDGAVLWRDNGPPGTPRSPVEEPYRFYRVVMLR
ncbi:MAG TPA: Ig-like domain-containing protein [Verrucomicrobiae bacterium]